VDKTARAVGRGCARQLAILAVAGTALLLFFGTALVVGWFLPLPPEWSVDRPVVVAGAMTIAASALVVASLVASAAYVFRRAMWLDEAFAAVALVGEAYQQSGRQYHGSWGGRRVDAYLSRGPTLDLYVESPLYTEVAVANREPLVKRL